MQSGKRIAGIKTTKEAKKSSTQDLSLPLNGICPEISVLKFGIWNLDLGI